MNIRVSLAVIVVGATLHFALAVENPGAILMMVGAMGLIARGIRMLTLPRTEEPSGAVRTHSDLPGRY